LYGRASRAWLHRHTRDAASHGVEQSRYDAPSAWLPLLLLRLGSGSRTIS
jgi:hypothetical protein